MGYLTNLGKTYFFGGRILGSSYFPHPWDYDVVGRDNVLIKSAPCYITGQGTPLKLNLGPEVNWEIPIVSSLLHPFLVQDEQVIANEPFENIRTMGMTLYGQTSDGWRLNYFKIVVWAGNVNNILFQNEFGEIDPVNPLRTLGQIENAEWSWRFGPTTTQIRLPMLAIAFEKEDHKFYVTTIDAKKTSTNIVQISIHNHINNSKWCSTTETQCNTQSIVPWDDTSYVPICDLPGSPGTGSGQINADNLSQCIHGDAFDMVNPIFPSSRTGGSGFTGYINA